MATEGKIPKLLVAINQAMGKASPTTKREPTGLLQFLFSSQNFTDKIQYDRGNSKNGEVEVKYIPRGTKSTVQLTQTADFVTSNKPTFKKANASVTGTFFQAFGLDLQDVEQILEGNDAMLKNLMSSEMEGLRQKIEEYYATQVALAFGINRKTGNNLTKAINIIKGATGLVDPAGVTQFKGDLRKNLFGNYSIIGDGNIMQFVDLVGLIPQDPLIQGNVPLVNLSQMQFSPYNSFEVESALGVNQAIVAENGALQPIVLNRYDNYKGMLGTATVMDTIVDDVIPRLEYDVKIKLNDAYPESYYVEFGARFGLFNVPSDAYKASDPMSGVNGVLRYTFTAV